MNHLVQRSLIPARRIPVGILRSHTSRMNAAARLSSRYISSSSLPLRNMSHTPDTYQKDDTISEPSSLKTNVVGGQPDDDPRTQRPFESPTGAYTTIDGSKPYDAPTNTPEEEGSKARYGGINEGGGGARDVHASDGPQDMGKTGRQ